MPAATGGGKARIAAGLLSRRFTSPPTRANASAGRWRGSSVASRAFMMAPKMATPNEPPIDRKNWVAEVATPKSRYSTAFCTTSIVTCMTEPMPKPRQSM